MKAQQHRQSTVRTLLRELGRTPERIEDNLRQNGVKLSGTSTAKCPIQQYVRREGYGAVLVPCKVVLTTTKDGS